jgi:hypothetical protein
VGGRRTALGLVLSHGPCSSATSHESSGGNSDSIVKWSGGLVGLVGLVAIGVLASVPTLYIFRSWLKGGGGFVVGSLLGPAVLADHGPTAYQF